MQKVITIAIPTYNRRKAIYESVRAYCKMIKINNLENDLEILVIDNCSDKYDILENGTLYVGKFNDDGSGSWLVLDEKSTGMKKAEICVHTRQAGSKVGGTTMDRPEWVASHPHKAEVYLALTNNTNRGKSEAMPINAANPRADKKDGTESINNQKMPTLSSLLKSIDWQHLTNGYPVRFHGDLHFENILWKPIKKQFVFLDWRQDFAGNFEIGDIYYDLAKLLHGLVVSHELITKNHFSIQWNDNAIIFDLQRKPILKECEQQFYQWCVDHGFSLRKIRILTALIYLNISALHHYPYSLFLYSLGKLLLFDELKKEN